MNVAIVMASHALRELLSRLLAQSPDYARCWSAPDGEAALAQCREERPDIILLDPSLPGRHGAVLTKQLMREAPCPILLVTPHVRERAAEIFESMRWGALDVVAAPALDSRLGSASCRALLRKLKTVGKLAPAPPAPGPSSSEGLCPIVAFGSSSGGPGALAAVLGRLPADFPGAIVVAQHIDLQFTEGLATWLDSQTPLRVRAVRGGAPPRPGEVLVAAGDGDLVLTPDRRYTYARPAEGARYTPSIDALFHSLAQNAPRPGTAVILSGMGKDGVEGLRALRNRGWSTLAQDEASSPVYGMPKVAAETRAAARIAAPADIAATLLRDVRAAGSGETK